MRIAQIAKAFNDNKIEKRIFWQLMREKLSALAECQELIGNHSVCDEIVIDKNNVVLSFIPEIHKNENTGGV